MSPPVAVAIIAISAFAAMLLLSEWTGEEDRLSDRTATLEWFAVVGLILVMIAFRF